MRLVTFRTPALAPQAGLLTELIVAPLGADMIAICTTICAQGMIPEQVGPSLSVDKVTLLAPILQPPKLLGVGINYRQHAVEMGMRIPAVPNIFSKLSSAVIGPRMPIVLPKIAKRVDYEAELAVVIGRRGKNIPAVRAMEYVFGYTIINDISAREFHNVDSLRWLMGKNFDTFAPVGPWIITADEIEDPHMLDISLEVEGRKLQFGNTRDMLFKIPDLIEFISKVVTLEPGDIIFTGTPGGVGYAQQPPFFLKPGIEVVAEISNIGELRNPVIAEL